MDNSRGSWFWKIVGALIVATIPPIIWFWMGIDREGRPSTSSPPPQSKVDEPKGGDLLIPGSVWSGTFDIIVSKDRNTKDMRLVINKREKDQFFGESHFNRGNAVFMIEGKIDQNAISWRNLKMIAGQWPKGDMVSPQNAIDLTGTITQDRIEARRKAGAYVLETKLQLERGR